MEQLVNVELIKDNPYQGRMTYKDIESLGRSIATEDIQEKPKARKVKGGFELKFGHRRLRAFLWLKDNFKALGLTDRYDGYKVMPLDIEELTDEEMNRGVIVENAQREDLTVIEEAKMMRDYGTRWNKTSEQVGEVFGKSGATVRGLVRLLDLPEDAQEKVASGEITQGEARKLLTIARVDATQMKQAVLNIASGMPSDEALDQAMRNSHNAFVMWWGWRDGTPLAGDHLWRIDMTPEKFPMKHLPQLTVKEAMKALDADDADAELVTTIIEVIRGNRAITLEQYTETHKQYADWIEKVVQLVNPPGCSACPFHSVSDKQHLCGFKPCHQRKKKAWLDAEVAKVAKKMDIPIYNPASDGKTVLILDRHDTAHAKLVKDKHAGIRVQPHVNEYQEDAWTESHLARLILTGEKVRVLKESLAAAKERAQASSDNRELEWKRLRERQEASSRFFKEVGSRPFAVVFKALDHIPAMIALARLDVPKKDIKDKKADVLAALRVEMAREAIDNLNGYDYDLRNKGPVAVAKYLQGVAKEWGVKLPDDFIETAKKFEPVSTETEKKK